MSSHLKALLAGTALIALCVSARADTPAASPAPAGVDNPVMGPAPSADYVWMPGHWNSEGGQWKWLAGHWELPPSRSAVWVAGHWAASNGQWVWVNGAWNVSEMPQSPNGPPAPPSAAATPTGQSVPTPSTAAPAYAYAVQGTPSTTYYYGPADYSVAYPGYYWANDPWAWALLPAVFFGYGWGHGGFHGGFHGGYHGGGHWH